MKANEPSPESRPRARRRERRYRLAGVLVLLLGLGGAGLVYWLGTRSAGMADDLSMLGYHQPEERQMQMLYGKQGALIEDLTQALQQPGTQAFLILVAAGIVAAGCFYFARGAESDHETR